MTLPTQSCAYAVFTMQSCRRLLRASNHNFKRTSSSPCIPIFSTWMNSTAGGIFVAVVGHCYLPMEFLWVQLFSFLKLRSLLYKRPHRFLSACNFSTALCCLLRLIESMLWLCWICLCCWRLFAPALFIGLIARAGGQNSSFSNFESVHAFSNCVRVYHYYLNLCGICFLQPPTATFCCRINLENSRRLWLPVSNL